MWSRLTHRDILLLSWKYPVHIPQTVPGGWVTLNIQWGNSRFMNHTQLLLKWMFNKANNYWKNRCGVSALPQLCLETSIHLNVANSNQLIVATCSKQGFRILVAANHLSSQWAVSTQTALGSESQSWVWVCCGCSLVAHYSLQTHFARSALRAMCTQQHMTSAKLADRSRSRLWWTFSSLFRTLIMLVRSENST